MSISEPLEPAQQDLINRHLNDVDHVLLESGVGPAERRRIADDLELQIHEMLARNGGAQPSAAGVRAVLAQLDAPDAYRGAAGEDNPNSSIAAPRGESTSRGRLRRLRSDRVFGGVCSGLARFLDVDPWNVRLLFLLFSMSGSVLLYGALWLAVPFDTNALEIQPPGRKVFAPDGEHSFPVAFCIFWLVIWLSFVHLELFIVPKFANIFSQLGGELPTGSRVLFRISDFLLHHFFLFGFMIMGLLYAAPVALFMALPKHLRPLLLILCGLLIAGCIYALYAPLFAIPKLIK